MNSIAKVIAFFIYIQDLITFSAIIADSTNANRVLQAVVKAVFFIIHDIEVGKAVSKGPPEDTKKLTLYDFVMNSKPTRKDKI